MSVESVSQQMGKRLIRSASQQEVYVEIKNSAGYANHVGEIVNVEDQQRLLSLQLSLFEMLMTGFNLEDREQRGMICQVALHRMENKLINDELAATAIAECRRRFSKSEWAVAQQMSLDDAISLLAFPLINSTHTKIHLACRKILDDITVELQALNLAWCLGRAFVPPDNRPVDYMYEVSTEWKREAVANQLIRGISGNSYREKDCRPLPYVLGSHHLIRLAKDYLLPELVRLIDLVSATRKGT